MLGSVEVDLGDFPWCLQAQRSGEQGLDLKGHGSFSREHAARWAAQEQDSPVDLWTARLRQPAHNPTGLDYDIVNWKSNSTRIDEGPAGGA